MNKLVSVEYLDNYSIKDVQKTLEKCFMDLDAFKLFKPKMKILIKPNLPFKESADKALTTYPTVVQAVVNILTDMGAICIIADSPYKKYSTEYLNEVYLTTGMLEVANSSSCELNQNLKTTNIVIDGEKTKQVEILDVYNSVDAIINIGKVKMDNTLGYLGATSNLFGLIPGEKKRVVLNRLNNLKDFYDYIIDLNNALKDKVKLSILDGIVALEANNTQRLLSCLAVSENCYALDSAILQILGVDLEKTILKQAQVRDVFDYSKPLKLVGENLNKFKLEDFALVDFDLNTSLCEAKKQKSVFSRLQKRVKIVPDKCKGCAICAKVCPTGAITMKLDKNKELYADVDYSKCIFCYKCHTACPYSVVDIVTPAGYKKIEKEINKFNDK